ncbi:hypothetical protein F5Y17DRAFT_265547 [Xylariaceae sp. FL0594]|nr:hypothetical protein F5Y17DRAFT_265547 [Xylariaceae sp. FL0594]
MSSVLAQLKPVNLKTRAVFVKCSPPAKNFYERRAVLAALQKCTSQSIEVFKKLEDNSSFFAVTTRPEAVTTLFNESPIERTIYTQDLSSDGSSSRSVWQSEVDLSGPIARPVDPLPVGNAAPTPAFNDLGLSQKNLTIDIFPLNEDYKHYEDIKSNPIYGRWPAGSKTGTFISTALRRVVPSGAMAPALRDWETGNQLSDDSFATAEEGAVATLLGQKRHTTAELFYLERVRRRAEEKATPQIMKSLVQFAADCKAQSESSPGMTKSSDMDGSWDKLPLTPKSQGQKPAGLLNNESFKKLFGK